MEETPEKNVPTCGCERFIKGELLKRDGNGWLISRFSGLHGFLFLSCQCQGGEGCRLLWQNKLLAVPTIRIIDFACKLLHGANSPVVALRCPTSEHTYITLPILLVVKYDRRLFEMIWHYRCTVILTLHSHYRITIHPASCITHHMYYMPHATYYIQTTYCTNSSSIIFIYHFVVGIPHSIGTPAKSLFCTALALPWVSNSSLAK